MSEIEKRNEDKEELIEKGEKYLNAKTAEVKEELKNWFYNNIGAFVVFENIVKEKVKGYIKWQNDEAKKQINYYYYLKSQGIEARSPEILEILVKTPEDIVRSAFNNDIVSEISLVFNSKSPFMGKLEDLKAKYNGLIKDDALIEIVINNALIKIATEEIAVKILPELPLQGKGGATLRS